jgi:molybdopterin synthase catalytic subunit
MSTQDAFVILTFDPLDPRKIEARVACDAAGAICTFQGVVRDHHLGREVHHLSYEAFPAMALSAMQAIIDEIHERWPGTQACIAHRIGRLAIGEASVIISVSSPHRAESFEACRYAIDTLKTTVPIWKKEIYEGGESWVEGVPTAPLDTNPFSEG